MNARPLGRLVLVLGKDLAIARAAVLLVAPLMLGELAGALGWLSERRTGGLA